MASFHRVGARAPWCPYRFPISLVDTPANTSHFGEWWTVSIARQSARRLTSWPAVIRGRPGWICAARLEWSFRLALEPRRLASRSLTGDPSVSRKSVRALVVRSQRRCNSTSKNKIELRRVVHDFQPRGAMGACLPRPQRMNTERARRTLLSGTTAASSRDRWKMIAAICSKVQPSAASTVRRG